jgi:hypothetical protein
MEDDDAGNSHSCYGVRALGFVWFSCFHSFAASTGCPSVNQIIAYIIFLRICAVLSQMTLCNMITLIHVFSKSGIVSCE